MKKIVLMMTAAAMMAGTAPRLSAGEKEWAAAGKILTGLVAGAVLAKALEPAPVYSETTVVYSAPPVVMAPPPPPPPPPVFVRPAPVVVCPTPVYLAPPPVYVPPPVVYYQPAPVVTYHFSFGRRYCPPPVYRICR